MSHSGSGNETSERNWFRAIRSDGFFQRIYQQAATGIAITDWLGVFQECNPAYCDLLGYTEEELRSVDFASLVHPDDREANLAQIRRLQAGEISSFDIENRYIHKDGAPMWVHQIVSVLPGENGEPAHLIALVTNTTGRARAEQALRESEERYRRLAEQVLDGIFVTDSQGRYVDANRAGCEMFGYTLEELKTLTVRDVIAPEELQKLPEQFQHLASGQVVRSDWRFKRKDASVFTGELVCRQFSDGRLQGIVRDMTERKTAELAVRASEQQLQSYLDHAGDGIYVMESESGRILNANEHAVQMLGYSRDELLKLCAADIEAAHLPTTNHAFHQQAIQGVVAVEGIHRRKDGSTFPVEIRLTSLAPAQPHLVLAMVRDITERKQAEEALRVVSAELRQTLHTAATGLTHCSRDLRYLSANPAYAE